ncbi:MAG: tetratricopeptide repeat protein [Fimbriimonas sp.]
MINHPAADAARAAQASCRFEEAARMLEHALQAEPRHPDLIAERAWLYALTGKEDTALGMLEAGRGGVRHAALENALYAHFLCRAKLDPLDFQAALARDRFQSLALPEVGVRITACLIAKNEAANLPRCLQSLHGLVDQIVVVDTGSTDETVVIAESYGAIVGHFEWRNDFAAARNAALDLASGDWILWIDADEELDRASAAALRRAVVRPHIGGFDIEIVNLVDDRPNGGHILHYPMRLFRRHPGIRFTGAIHEQIQPAVAALGLPWARLEGARLIHHGYRPSALAGGAKLARTRSMLEEAVRREPNDGFQWFNLANALLTEGNAPEAERCAREALRLIRPGAPWRGLTWQILTSALLRQDRAAESAAACDACDADGDGGLLNEFERAQALLAQGQAEAALLAIDKCITLPWPEGMTGDVGVATHKRYVLRGHILGALGRLNEALAMFDRALEGSSGFGPALVSRAATYERLGHPVRAIADYEEALDDPHCRIAAQKGLGRARLAAGQPGAAAMLADAWHAAPEDHETWVLWVHACEATGDTAGLLEAYEAVAAKEELDAAGLIDWGRALLRSGEAERALACYTEAIQRDPTCANAYFNAGDLLYQLGAYPDAAHVYEAGLRHAPDNADAWFTLGNALAQLNLEDGARLAYDQALALMPDHASARHNRALMAA